MYEVAVVIFVPYTSVYGEKSQSSSRRSKDISILLIFLASQWWSILGYDLLHFVENERVLSYQKFQSLLQQQS